MRSTCAISTAHAVNLHSCPPLLRICDTSRSSIAPCILRSCARSLSAVSCRRSRVDALVTMVSCHWSLVDGLIGNGGRATDSRRRRGWTGARQRSQVSSTDFVGSLALLSSSTAMSTISVLRSLRKRKGDALRFRRRLRRHGRAPLSGPKQGRGCAREASALSKALLLSD